MHCTGSRFFLAVHQYDLLHPVPERWKASMDQARTGFFPPSGARILSTPFMPLAFAPAALRSRRLSRFWRCAGTHRLKYKGKKKRYNSRALLRFFKRRFAGVSFFFVFGAAATRNKAFIDSFPHCAHRNYPPGLFPRQGFQTRCVESDNGGTPGRAALQR